MNFYDRKRIADYGDDLVKCPICKKLYARLGSHAIMKHGYSNSAEFYKEFMINRKDGTSNTYKQIMKEHTLENGTYHNCESGKSTRYVKGDKRIITKQWWKDKKNAQM